MIDVPQARAAIAAVDGDHVAYSKEQMAQLLTELEEGQQAKREAARLRAAVGAALLSAPVAA